MAKFLTLPNSLGRVKLPSDDTQGGPGAPSTDGGTVGRPTGQRTIPVQYANAAQYASTQPFMPVQQMQPMDQPSPPTQPPPPTPDVPDPGLACPAGTAFDIVTGRCIPQYPTPQTPTSGNGGIVPTQPQTMTEAPPGYYLLFGRPYPMWTLYLATGTLGFGVILLAFLVGRRRKRASAT